jgi:hypothetical protein
MESLLPLLGALRDCSDECATKNLGLRISYGNCGKYFWILVWGAARSRSHSRSARRTLRLRRAAGRGLGLGVIQSVTLFVAKGLNLHKKIFFYPGKRPENRRRSAFFPAPCGNLSAGTKHPRAQSLSQRAQRETQRAQSLSQRAERETQRASTVPQRAQSLVQRA